MKMKQISVRSRSLATILTSAFLLAGINKSEAQICASPGTTIYGLTGTGAIYPINVSNATLGTVVKNTTYSGNAVNKANGLAYNNVNGRFYYFKRNVGSSAPNEFVSYDPSTATVTVLATTTCADEVHTGCITADGLGYYTIDTDANLNYYNIVLNTWTYITSTFTDQDNNDVSAIIRNQDAGDIAFDGDNDLWMVTSNSSNYGVYRLPGNLPVLPVAGLKVQRRLTPTTPTPSNKSIAGIAFSSTGQIYMSTKQDNGLYRLENNLTTTFIGTFPVSDIGNDLTSCSFPLGVLPVKWVGFSASMLNNNAAELKWEVAETENAGFTVQYSADGSNWKNLGFVQSHNKETGNYSYTHTSPAAGRNYYRIKMTELSGKESYSEVKMIAVKTGNASVSVWPNPASDFISISSTGSANSHKTVNVFDLAGKKQLSKELQAGENSINISRLNSGTYILTVQMTNGTSMNQKFIKR